MGRFPLVYEVNTHCWLRDLSEAAGFPLTLDTVPDSELASWSRLGFTHIWLMGVWRTGPKARALALRGLRHDAAAQNRPFPWDEDDVIASPYAVADYSVSPALGGNPALARFRRRLHLRGLKLLLDFVPNHLGVDHRWICERPGLFVHHTRARPGAFRRRAGAKWLWFAHGRDPYFPPWIDTVQLDYRREETHSVMRDALIRVAGQCDGVRCDMAMLVLNEVFDRTWKEFSARETEDQSHNTSDAPVRPLGAREPHAEFWTGAIQAVRAVHPEFLFLAEAYWGLEGRLQELGFDYTYDKRVWDLLAGRKPEELQQHLLSSAGGQPGRSAYFIENHDEPRAASTFRWDEHRAAAFLMLCLPGLRLLHEGQLDGRRHRVPVQLSRRPVEAPNREIRNWYEHLLLILNATSVNRGEAELLTPLPIAPGDESARGMIAVLWTSHVAPMVCAVVNLAAKPGRCRLRWNLSEPARVIRTRVDLLGGEAPTRLAPGQLASGFEVVLPGHGARLYQLS